MKLRKLILLIFSLVFMQYSNAASLDFLRPTDGDTIRSSFQFVARLLDSPPGRPVTVAIGIRDAATGDELSSKVIQIQSPGRRDMLIERFDLPENQSGREVTITVGERDKETGDELVSGMINVLIK